MKNLFIRFTCGLIVLVCTQSCAPVFSELQSARLAGAGRVEATPYYSTTSLIDEESTEGVQNHLGLQLAYGISPKVDFRIRYENLWLKGDGVDEGLSLIGFGPKFSFIQDKVALFLPFGSAISKDIENSWEFQPTLLLTLPVVPKKIDFTIAPKYVIEFCEDCPNYFAFNTGFSISSDVTKWALRPEYGYLFGSDTNASHFSLGLSFMIGRKK